MKRNKSRGVVCAESLESRRLFSKLLADPSAAVLDPPAGSSDGELAAMNASVTYPLSDCPQLSSNPGAPATIYLDFTGDTTSAWGTYAPGTTPAYDTDGDPTTFSSTELANIEAIWAQVSDTYSPFNVNVTTINPGNNNNPNLEIVIGGAGTWTKETLGGIAYIGSFAGSASVYGASKNKVFVFPTNLGAGSPRLVADDAEHEAGHAFGLSHQSVWTEITTTTPPTYTLTSEYNTGTPAAGPIMGNPLSDTRAMWWNGTADYEVSGSPYVQNDMSVISSAANGFGYRPDNYGDSIATATPLSGSGNAYSINGVVTTNTDADFFSFNTGAAAVTLNAIAGGMYANPNPTLNVDLQLFNSSGTLVGTETGGLSKSISATLAAGTYYVEISGDGTYGDVGSYTLNVAGPDKYQPDNTFATAADLGPVASLTEANLSVNASGSDDYYSFTPVSTGPLDANITFTNAVGALGLYLYNSNQSLLGSAIGTAVSKQDISLATVTAGQKYYLRVTGLSGATNANYTLNITAPAPTWLSNVNNLSYVLGGTSANPTLDITGGTGLLTADVSTVLSNWSVSVETGASLQMQTNEHLASLQLNGNATAQLVSGSDSQLTVNNLLLSNSSTLDLTENSLLWIGGSQSQIQAWLKSGYNSGAWTGPGIISSSATEWSYCGLGYSNTIDPGDVLVKFASDGDTNLDGQVNADDMSMIALGQKSGGTTWQQGDFNYDGKVTEDDFFLAFMGLAEQGVNANAQNHTAPV